MHKAFKACTAVLLALVMTVSLVNGALAAVVRNDDDTISYEPLEQGVYSKGGYTIDKVSHPTLGAGEVDGILTGDLQDRGQSYSWSMAEAGDYVYIGTCYNSTYYIYHNNVKTSLDAMKKEGKLTDMTKAEFADYYRQKKTYTEPECALWRDILYGSDKQLFWYCDPFMRACVNMDQGGAIVDLRPYAAKLEWPVGIGTKHVTDASYPFLIQEKYRAGYFTHYAGEGTVRSAKLKHNGEEVDLCLCRTKAHFSQEGNTRILTLDPVDIEFYDLTVKLQTIVSFEEGSSAIKIERKILEMSDPNAEVELNEYIVACYGTTEYSEDMLGITLSTKKGDEVETLDYEYKCREMEKAEADEVRAVIPQIETAVSMSTNAEGAVGYVKEGYAFSPMFTLGYNSKIKDKEVVATWLKLEKAN